MKRIAMSRIGGALAGMVLVCVFWMRIGLGAARAGVESPATFTVENSQLRSPLTVIAYGDTRFTDPTNTSATNPKVRQWLVQEIAKEAPDAVLVNGDIPLSGSVKNDYTVFKRETKVWSDLHLRIFPVLGNHELNGSQRECLENWWDTFPELRGRRWYSVQLGSRVYIIALDSNESSLTASEQGRWLKLQLDSLPVSVDFVFLSLHHPPVADVQGFHNASHNPRANEIALQRLLSDISPHRHARFIVTAGHVHNYERRIQDNVLYLVCGGGGAKPYPVERTPGDLYTRPLFPNYHYVKFTLEEDRMHGTMFRVSEPSADAPHFMAEDNFDVIANP